VFILAAKRLFIWPAKRATPFRSSLIVARIEFLEWTPENRLRHPRFAGIRRDKDGSDVLREQDGSVVFTGR
jgi:ATP-dependent DNA ligase